MPQRLSIASELVANPSVSCGLFGAACSCCMCVCVGMSMLHAAGAAGSPSVVGSRMHGLVAPQLLHRASDTAYSSLPSQKMEKVIFMDEPTSGERGRGGSVVWVPLLASGCSELCAGLEWTRAHHVPPSLPLHPPSAKRA